MSGCGLLQSLLEGFAPSLTAGEKTSGLVQLHLVNRSGLPVVVEAEYTIDDSQVRQTRRELTGTGPESQSDVLATTTKLLHVKATVAGDATSQPATSEPTTASKPATVVLPGPGDVLMDVELVWKVDFHDGDRLEIDITLPQPPNPDIIDCNGNGISDADDIAAGTSSDCNCNGVPDECDLADGTLHDADPADGVPDECVHCPPVDVVFIMDTSGSMDDEAAALCGNIHDVVAILEAKSITLHVAILGINEVLEGPYSCLTDSVTNLLGDSVPNGTECCAHVTTNEDWGPAVSVVAARYGWTEGAVRVIVPISDEGPSRGDPCDDPGDDRDAITTAIANAKAAHAIVSPIMAN
ncbi:MAG TPA: hypothetical protein VMV81_02715, partial [Phycisphaerae bacterium]|nr:hypothetical protein [Phycisphaerae bacterium]